VEQQLHDSLAKIEDKVDADVLGFSGSIYYGVEDFVRDAVEKRSPKRERLLVIIDTNGGLIEVAQRMADTLRHHYPKSVEFLIPNYAMSAGTVLVMSGDAIYMDYYSVLGPVDPQVLNREGKWVPALGYLAKYEELVKKSGTKKGLTDAEMAYFASHFDPADLYSYEQAKNLSMQLLNEWLVKYKFKNWDVTETRRKKVTPKMKKDRAYEIAEMLNDADRWNSHARPIGMEILRRDMKLKIEDFGEDANLTEVVRNYYRLLRDYMGKMGHNWAIHMVNNYAHIGGAHV
jgi:ClpP class serine protease